MTLTAAKGCCFNPSAMAARPSLSARERMSTDWRRRGPSSGGVSASAASSAARIAALSKMRSGGQIISAGGGLASFILWLAGRLEPRALEAARCRADHGDLLVADGGH